MSTNEKEASTWAPLASRIFRALWIANLVSNIGTWIQTVGAQWLLVHQPHAPILVALVQTADMLPDVLLAYIGGVLADLFDRRRLLLAVQGYLVLTGLALTVLTYMGQMPPALLLTLTFVLGAASAFSGPAYQAILPEIVPRDQLPAASALGGVSINLARAVGPAIAGVVVEQAGVGAAFALNTATFLAFGLVVAAWRPPARDAVQHPERFFSALRAGSGYVRNSPVVRRILLRSTLFLVPASALWALLPLVASRTLKLGAGGYGILLAAIGVGAVAGIFLLPRLRSRMEANVQLLAASLVYAAALAVLALVPNLALSLIVLVPTGVVWLAVLSAMNSQIQLFLPKWVRARGLSVYQMVLFGAQAAGSVVWGAMAGAAGLEATLLTAAAVMAAGIATIAFWPLLDTKRFDTSLAVYWPEPHLVIEPGLQEGHVLVTQSYSVAPENERPFLQAMNHVRQSRLRTGAVGWTLYRDGEGQGRFIETFVVPSWEEHLRQHGQRQTATDRKFEEQAESLRALPQK